MDWRLRSAGEGDAPALAMVAAASFLETFAGVLSGADIVVHCAAKSSVRAFAAWIADPAAVVTIAEHPHGAAPVGYAVLCAPDLPVDPVAGDIELRRIYTLSIARGTGLGAALMTRAVADALGRGAKRMLIGVYAGNDRARAFYERQGFGLAGARRFLVGSTWHDDVIYARDL